MPMADACDRGLSTQGGGTRAANSPIAAWLRTCTNVGHEQPGGARPDAHGELVAEIARGGLAHARRPQVLAQQRRRLDVEIVEGDDAIDRLGAREVAHALDEVVGRRALPDVEDVVDRLARPGGAGQRIDRDEQDAATLALRRAQELGALLVRGDAEHGERSRLGHVHEDWSDAAAGSSRPPPAALLLCALRFLPPALPCIVLLSVLIVSMAN